MKLLHLTTSLKMGGAETVLVDLIKNLDPHQFDQRVIYFHDGPHRVRLQALRIPTHQVKGLFCLYDPIFWYRLARLLKQHRPDCLHTLLWSANVAGRIMARFLGIPCVTVWHNNVDQDGWLRNALDRLTVVAAGVKVAVSAGVATSVVRQKVYSPAQMIQVIPNGIDYESVQERVKTQACTRQERGLAEGHFVIGSVGRFEPVKNYPLLINAFATVYANYPHARLVLVGSGSQEMALRKQASTLGLEREVIFVVGQSAYRYYPLFDCFVQSSHNEGLSIALLEALSCGLAAVVTTSDPVHPVIEHGINGLCVPVGDRAALAQNISILVGNPQKRCLLGLSAQQQVQEHYSINKMVASYRGIFLQLGYKREKMKR